jgi:hypothetical protein
VRTTSVFSNGQSFFLKYGFFFCNFSGFCYLFCKVLRRTWVDTSLLHTSNCTAQRVFARRCVYQVLSWNTEHGTIFQRLLLLWIPRSSFLRSSLCHRTRWLKWLRFWLMCGKWPVRISTGTPTVLIQDSSWTNQSFGAIYYELLTA